MKEYVILTKVKGKFYIPDEDKEYMPEWTVGEPWEFNTEVISDENYAVYVRSLKDAIERIMSSEWEYIAEVWGRGNKKTVITTRGGFHVPTYDYVLRQNVWKIEKVKS